MPRKANYAAAAVGITAKEYADAVKDGYRGGGAGKKEATRAGSAAFRSAVRGGAKRK